MARKNSGPDAGLNHRQARFCEEYIVDLDAMQAAIRAGYSEKSAGPIARNLLQKDPIQKKIQRLKMIRSDAVASRAEDTIREVALLAHSDIADFITFDENNNPTPKAFGQLKPEQSRCIRRIKHRKTIRRVAGKEGEELVESVLEFDLWDKVKALDLEGQYHTIWNQKGGEISEDTAAALLEKVADALEGRHGTPGQA